MKKNMTRRNRTKIMPRKVGLVYDAHIPREREFPSYLISINSFYRWQININRLIAHIDLDKY